LAVRYDALYCYEVHDLWPLSPLELGGFSKYHPFIMIMQWAENYAYKHADFVVSLLPAALPHMVSHGLNPENFFYIPNGIIADEWNAGEKIPASHQEELNKIRSRHNFIIAYAGSHGVANSLHSFVLAGKQLTSDYGLVLVGDGPEKAKLMELVKNEGITNVYFLPPVKKQFIPSLLAFFDALFIGLQKQSLFRFGISPNKLIDYMMAGKPVVQAIEAGNNMVREYACGIDVEPENAGAIAKGIEQIMQLSEDEKRVMGKNGRSAAVNFHDYKILCKRFIEAANTVTNKKILKK
jgi:glycosyltransferase involved in cell wall biosynthesis